VAGSGLYGYSGDNEAATAASMMYPSGIAVSSAGDYIFADTNNNVIRKVMFRRSLHAWIGCHPLVPYC
jgi:hypothetical protein